MREPEPIQLSDGQTLLIIVKEGRVIEFTWDMGLPHVEFVKRRVGELPADAWVGTVSKIEGRVAAMSSKHWHYCGPANLDARPLRHRLATMNVPSGHAMPPTG